MFEPSTNKFHTALTTKRQQYRTELRRLHLLTHRRATRKALSSASTLTFSFQLCQNIAPLMHQRQHEQILEDLEHLSKLLGEEEEHLSLYENQLMERLAEIIKVNASDEQSEKEEGEGSEIQQETCTKPERIFMVKDGKVRGRMVKAVLKVMGAVAWEGYDEKRIMRVCRRIWVMFEAEEEDSVIRLMKILTNMLRDNDRTLQVVKQLGLGQQLSRIINQHLPSTYPHLLSLLLQYLLSQDRLLKPSPVLDLTKQLLNNEQRNYFLAFSLEMVESGHPVYCQLGLEVLSVLIQLNNYLCEFVNEEALGSILGLVKSTNLKVVRTALEVLDSLVFFSKGEVSREVLRLQGMDVLEEQICREERMDKDPEQRLRLTKICHIVCNLISINDPCLRRKVKSHTLIDRVYQLLTPNSKFLCLSRILLYFLQATELKPNIRIVDAVISAIAKLDLSDSNDPDVKVLKEIVVTVYSEAVEWTDDEDLIGMVERYGLGWVVEEVG